MTSTLVVLALVALPAVAQAGHNNDFFDGVPMNSPGSVLGSFSQAHNNNSADTQPGEEPVAAEDIDFTLCADVYYGATVWYRFFPHVKGRVHVTVTTSAGFRPVASVIRWSGDGAQSANLIEGLCNGPIPGLNRTDVPINGYIDVVAGQQYAVQVGGAKSPNDPTGTADTGNYSLFFEYDPDTDGDGLFDSSDECDTEGGSATHAGCPDSDGDNIANRNDACPGLGGVPTFQGCPDADGDGVPEGGQDKCEGLNPRSVNRNDSRPRDGCPDTLPPSATVKKTAVGTPNGISFTSFTVTKVPRGARVVVKCKLPSRRSCGGLTVRRASADAAAPVRAKAARNLRVRKLIGKALPYGTTITVRVTAQFAAGRFIRLKVVRSGSRLSEKVFCMRPGSNKLRRRGCT